ncbi:C2 domain [Plasmopara halstedii]|uniref:C2 domain n=1 Tax=Plasmopara halstedii TaxID=4781 RepID=A0A0P1AJB4_PLAHL|nr:C2 domain [Plasmopara halstedii]CEG41029.1 C2 domain [Plasmopara halstedii]|eukprot:XP_024577398.1 C2 domain [Plasmopara halstedii]
MASPLHLSLPRYKLVLRVYSAKDIQHSSSQGAYCKLYLGSSIMIEGSRTCKTSLDVSSVDQDEKTWHFQVRRTCTQHQQSIDFETIWDETFEVLIHPNMDLKTQILSFRVKSQHLLYCPVIGTCAVSLKNFVPGKWLQQWYPLQKGKKSAGRLRVMLLVTEIDRKIDKLVARRRQPNEDVVAARNALYEADKAIERLLEKHLQLENERQERRRAKLSCGPLELQKDSFTIDRNVEDSVTPLQPSFEILETFETQPLHVEQLPTHLVKYEQQLDKKLRQVQKETVRLYEFQLQLKQYLPDFKIDNETVESKEDLETLPFETFDSSALSNLEHFHCRARSNEIYFLNCKQEKQSKGMENSSVREKLTDCQSEKHVTAVVA